MVSVTYHLTMTVLRLWLWIIPGLSLVPIHQIIRIMTMALVFSVDGITRHHHTFPNRRFSATPIIHSAAPAYNRPEASKPV
jgi:hypothetical protein